MTGCGGATSALPAPAVGFATILLLAGIATSARGAPEIHQLRPGTYELGLGGSFLSVEGSSETMLALRFGRFFGSRPGSSLVGGEVELGYGHVAELDQLDVAAHVSWQPVIEASPLHPFVAVSGGLRQEWIGSFRQKRYPVGVDVGLRALVGPRVLIRMEYRYRRVLDDPVADFTEHSVVLGLSLLFGPSR